MVTSQTDTEVARLSLADGDDLTPATWADFVQRLHHDCVGDGVRSHCTAEALFTVEARRLVYGIDSDYSQDLVLTCEDREWFSPEEYWNGLSEAQREGLDRSMQELEEKNFLDADEDERWEILGKLPEHSVVGYQETWEYVNSHLTKDAAEAFIRRKKHDYRKGLRVSVESQIFAWEFNTIKNAVLTGRLQLVDAPATA
ncbi:hypothetical protein H8F21_14275 [Pseudomonas sp. P66]|uniref:Uncharacterized protein n=1 Tax=Pseudomonas arcuscaelestis TaxID=2710591 RepID=A0ABS2BYM9_9PSED|nr:hypothetical protein [Pseudomonas arcuscaelestis]